MPIEKNCDAVQKALIDYNNTPEAKQLDALNGALAAGGFQGSPDYTNTPVDDYMKECRVEAKNLFPSLSSAPAAKFNAPAAEKK